MGTVKGSVVTGNRRRARSAGSKPCSSNMNEAQREKWLALWPGIGIGVRDNWRGGARMPGLGPWRSQLTPGASQPASQAHSGLSHSQPSNTKPQNHEAIPVIAVGWFAVPEFPYWWHL